MAWNTSNKAVTVAEQKAIPYGAPVSTNAANQERGYYDGWDIERVFKEGVKKVTWVYRCIDAIAGNQARLPMVGRHGNKPDGAIVVDDEILDLLNLRANPGEDAFAFRYRLSAQLLTSTRGAFVEVLRGRGGKVIALNLLPPQYTSPVPDAKKFVKAFQVHLPGQPRTFLNPADVLWFKHPHPLDPYLSMTPLESAGVAVEIEVLAKFYNRSFLLNDGRPGGLLVVRGEMDDDDKSELAMRFRGNVQRAGSISVIASEEGVDFVDTGANPRDAAYIQMRQITKEEILSAFGVPESVIGNAAGRTFSNALEETRVFWLETMPQHLHMLCRGFDPLHDELWFDFDTSKVPVLMSAEQEKHRYLMQEFQAGLLTANEYRDGTGRKKVEADLADSMLANPNLAPIGNTARKLDFDQGAAPGMPGAPGMPPGPDGGVPPAAPPPEPGKLPAPAPASEGGVPDGMVQMADGSVVQRPPGEPTPEYELSAHVGTFGTKQAPGSGFPASWDTKAEADADRWVEIMDTSLERLFDRQQRVVLEKATGAKARRSLSAKELTVDQIFDTQVWNRQLREDVAPLLSAIVKDAISTSGSATGRPTDPSSPEVQAYIDQQMERLEKANSTTREELAGAILTSLAMNESDEDGHLLLKAAIVAIFAHLLAKRRRRIAEHEAQAAYNAGVWLAAEQVASQGGRPAGAVEAGGDAAGPTGGIPVSKTWVTRMDAQVRDSHRLLHGKTVPLDEGFEADGTVLRFPGDPLAPPSLTIGCRCRLRFGV
jgi:HK97 family phage portal protein